MTSLTAALFATVSAILAALELWIVSSPTSFAVLNSLWLAAQLSALVAFLVNMVGASGTDREVTFTSAVGALCATLGTAGAVTAFMLVYVQASRALVDVFSAFITVALLGTAPAWSAFALAARARSLRRSTGNGETES